MKRLQKPERPVNLRQDVRAMLAKTGETGRICPQAVPDWVPDKGPLSLPDQSEDCLWLDVLVDSGSWDNREKDNVAKAPVLVWFHDGKWVTSLQCALNEAVRRKRLLTFLS